nr:ribonuclease H-like domain-containing protein [Tanacetum cinerariifolium]
MLTFGGRGTSTPGVIVNESFIFVTHSLFPVRISKGMKKRLGDRGGGCCEVGGGGSGGGGVVGGVGVVCGDGVDSGVGGVECGVVCGFDCGVVCGGPRWDYDPGKLLCCSGFIRKYATEILEHAGMVSCNSSRTHVNTESKLCNDGDPVYLYMHDPREPHFLALKRILRYVPGTLDYGLQLFSSSTTDLCEPTLSRSSAEAEYRGVANVVVETCCLRNLLFELHTPLSSATLVYCDNVNAVYLSSNPVQHERTKHIEIDIHFVQDLVSAGQVHVLHVPSRYQYANIFTKGFPSTLFEEFHTSLSVRCPPAPIAVKC